MTKVKKANSKRGEVDLEIEGETLVFCAYMDRMAALTEELCTNDIYAIRDLFFPGREVFVRELKKDAGEDVDETETSQDEDEIPGDLFDIRHTYVCARHLCISHTEDQLKTILRYEHLPRVGMAVLGAIFTGLGDDNENQGGQDDEKKSVKNADESTKN